LHLERGIDVGIWFWGESSASSPSLAAEEIKQASREVSCGAFKRHKKSFFSFQGKRSWMDKKLQLRA